MPIHNHTQRAGTARQRLVEAEGTPFAPSESTRPLVALMDGRRTNADLSPEEWVRGIETADGTVALYLRLPCDHEWWLAYAANDDEWHRWTTYPSGPWDPHACERWVIETNIEMIDEHRPEGETGIYRSRVVCIEDAPEFVRREVTE